MSIDQEQNVVDEDEYDEDADSDFHADGANDEDISATSDDEADEADSAKPRKKQKIITQSTTTPYDAPELDSGDEATIKEQKRARRKQKKKGEDVEEASEDEETGWRARTRAMRERDKNEKKLNRLANIKGSTIDVEKMWEEMNRPGLPSLAPPAVEMEGVVTADRAHPEDSTQTVENGNRETPAPANEDMITIKRKFKFAGEVHTEEKIVPKSSAEARLWLAQQDSSAETKEDGTAWTQRPLRKVSRFDPNYNNLAAFKVTWTRNGGENGSFKGPKLNVVEKSKLDWASHVDAEGFKDELDVHARAKEGYHSRMEFLSQVEQRKEEEARQARLKK